MKKLIALAVLSAIGLAGCGSDSDSSTPPPTTPEQPTPAPHYDNMDVSVDIDSSFNDGIVRLYLGRWYPCTNEHPEMCDADMPDDGTYTVPLAGNLVEPTPGNSVYGKQNLKDFPNSELGNEVNNHMDIFRNKYFNVRTRDDSKYYMEAPFIEFKAYMEREHEGKSIRDDVFVAGQYSVLDLMQYTAAINPHFEVTDITWNDDRRTFDYKVNFDANGDGDFDDFDQGDRKDSELWSAAVLPSQGKNLKRANPMFDTPYDRLDEYWIKPDMHVRFQPVSETFLARKRQYQQDEADILDENDGKMIISQLRAFSYFPTSPTDRPNKVLTDIEVKPYNLRPDVYQKDVITVMDIFMSAHHAAEQDIDIRIGFWPTLETGVISNQYIVTSVDGQRQGTIGMSGWMIQPGQDKNAKDFFTGDSWPKNSEWPTAQELVDADPEGPFRKERMICHWMWDQDQNMELEEAQDCIDHWFTAYGGNGLHRPFDTYTMLNPKQAVTMVFVTPVEASKYEIPEYYHADEKHPDGYVTYDIEKAIAPLQSSHFGWGVADCGMCHGIDNTHLAGGDSPALPEGDLTKPYFCASCHGGNGAPAGHGENFRCHFCHGNEKQMSNHGEASLQVHFSEIKCDGTTATGREVPETQGFCADAFLEKYSLAPGGANQMIDEAHNGTFYRDLPKEDQYTSPNNSWHTTDTFPDPYSCVTCHPNQ